MARITSIVRSEARSIAMDAMGLIAMAALLVLALHLPEVLSI